VRLGDFSGRACCMGLASHSTGARMLESLARVQVLISED
jgi:hypothetical protein